MKKPIPKKKKKQINKPTAEYPDITLQTDLSFDELMREALKPSHPKSKVKKKK